VLGNRCLWLINSLTVLCVYSGALLRNVTVLPLELRSGFLLDWFIVGISTYDLLRNVDEVGLSLFFNRLAQLLGTGWFAWICVDVSYDCLLSGSLGLLRAQGRLIYRRSLVVV